MTRLVPGHFSTDTRLVPGFYETVVVAPAGNVTSYYYQTFISEYKSMQKNVASQKFVVFAFNRTTNVPLTGDASNITANLQKDFGTSTATNDVNPTETEDGFYAFDATQAETNADALVIYPASTTSDIQVIGVPAVLYTVSAGSPDESVQSADHTSAIADIDTDVNNLNDFDPANDDVAVVTLVTTTTTNTDMRGTDSALLSADISLTAGAVDNVTLVATTTTNTDMRGTDGVDTATMRGTDGVDTATMRGTDSAATSAKQDTMETTLNAIPTTAMRGTDNAATSAKQDTMETTLNAIPTTAMRGTDNAATEAKQDIIDTNVDAILVDTGTTLPSQISALNDLSASDIATFQLTESYAADGVAPTFAQSLLLTQQFLFERVTASTTVTVKKLDGSATAATLTLDDAVTPTSITRAT